jgi:uncharacterized membrane protein YfcA
MSITSQIRRTGNEVDQDKGSVLETPGNLSSVSVAGVVTAETVKLYLLDLPALLAGLWLGFKLYGKPDDAAFRKLMLLLLLVSGLALIVARAWPSRLQV